jgi:single-strand DNA-binding protein
VLVEGRLNADKDTGGPRLYTKSDGSSGASFEITAFEVKFLSNGSHAQDKDETEDGNNNPPPF